jgi:hypothetical protein
MSTFILPIEQTRSHEFEVPLDNVLFRLRFTFNQRDSFWYMDIYNGTSGALLRAGVKLVTQWDLLRTWADTEQKPEGTLMMVPQGEAGLEATTLEMFGREALLTYTGES